MPRPKNTLTPQQAEQFEKHIAFWQTTLNLCDWRIERGQQSAADAMADVILDSAQRLAVYRLGDFKSTSITEQSLSMTALHEVLHIFLHDLIEAARDRGASDEQVESQAHRVINVLERLLYREVYAKQKDQ